MTPLDEILTTIADTSIARTSREVLAIYKGLDEAAEFFSAACAITCPDGCGRCCEGFDPPVTRAEADLVALHLICASIRVPAGSADHPCPFFISDAQFHCGIYPVRPLVCRAFGFSAVGGKDGAPCFHFCKHMPGQPHTQLDAQSMRLLFRQSPPRVEEYGIRISAISHEGMGEQPHLSAAIFEALDRARALHAYVRAAEAP
jgi:uncharacterized protein